MKLDAKRWLLAAGLIATVGLAILLLAPRPGPEAPLIVHSDRLVECHNGVVVSVSGLASDVGVAMLKDGGNAVDAAVATAFALAVVYPLAGNIGGGGFMMVHPAPGQGDPVTIDYRETSPAAATRTMFAKDESQYTHKAVATPGTIRGLELVHKRFGSLPWAKLIQPAIAFARDGFVLDGFLLDSLNTNLKNFREFPEFQRVFGKPDGKPWQAGDRLLQPDLAGTLQLLADAGPDAFYTGPIGADIAAEMVRGKGLITAADLANYRAIERKPLTTRYRDKFDVYVPPPPSSGGTCLIEELHMLEMFDIKGWGRWSPQTLHVMVECMRRASYDRARYIGDPALVEIPARLTTREYGHELAKTIDLNKATRSESLAGDIKLTPESESTTHFSIIDKQGMAVSNTYTLERHWGSRVVVRNRGFLLNNDMWAFNRSPGLTDRTGNIGTEPNTIAPGKRMITSQTPTIVARDGKVLLVTGSPGSRAIPHTVLGILIGVLDFDEPVEQAVRDVRMSHQWFPDNVVLEAPEKHPEMVESFGKMGHAVVRNGPLPAGDAHTIHVVRPGTYVGAADFRIGGKAAGY